jgi:hypothetical protein
MVLCAGRGDKGIDFREGVGGDDVNGLELLRKGCSLRGFVRGIGVRSGFGRPLPCKAGEDDDKKHEA